MLLSFTTRCKQLPEFDLIPGWFRCLKSHVTQAKFSIRHTRDFITPEILHSQRANSNIFPTTPKALYVISFGMLEEVLPLRFIFLQETVNTFRTSFKLSLLWVTLSSYSTIKICSGASLSVREGCAERCGAFH